MSVQEVQFAINYLFYVRMYDSVLLIVSVHTCKPDSGASYTCLWYSWEIENFNIGNMTNMSHCTGTHTCVCISAGIEMYVHTCDCSEVSGFHTVHRPATKSM